MLRKLTLRGARRDDDTRSRGTPGRSLVRRTRPRAECASWESSLKAANRELLRGFVILWFTAPLLYLSIVGIILLVMASMDWVTVVRFGWRSRPGLEGQGATFQEANPSQQPGTSRRHQHRPPPAPGWAWFATFGLPLSWVVVVAAWILLIVSLGPASWIFGIYPVLPIAWWILTLAHERWVLPLWSSGPDDDASRNGMVETPDPEGRE